MRIQSDRELTISMANNIIFKEGSGEKDWKRAIQMTKVGQKWIKKFRKRKWIINNGYILLIYISFLKMVRILLAFIE